MQFVQIDNAGKKVKGYNDKNDEKYKTAESWIRSYDFALEGNVVLSSLASGGSHQVSGREYKMASFTHVVSSASPVLWEALVENTKLDIEVHLTRSVVEGNTPHEKGYMQYKFKGAKISLIRDIAADKEGQAYMQRIEFTFNQLIWNADDDTTGEKTEAEDAINVA